MGSRMEIRRVQHSQLARNAQATARGRRMLGTRGALPEHASESSRQQGVPHRKVAGRLLGASLRMEKRTLHEFFCGCTMIFSHRIKRRDLYRSVAAPSIIAGRGEMVRQRSGRFEWTVQVGYPPPLTESGVRRRAQEKAIRETLEVLQKKKCRGKAAKHTDSGTGFKLGFGAEGSK